MRKMQKINKYYENGPKSQKKIVENHLTLKKLTKNGWQLTYSIKKKKRQKSLKLFKKLTKTSKKCNTLIKSPKITLKNGWKFT